MILSKKNNIVVCNALSGVHYLGNSPISTFKTTTNFSNYISHCGIVGSTTVLIENGTYEHPMLIDSVPGLSSICTLSIKSASGNPDDVVLINLWDHSKPTIRINQSDYIDISNLTIVSHMSPGLVLGKGSSYFKLKNCKVLGYSFDANIKGLVIDKYDPASCHVRIENNFFSGNSNGIFMRGLNDSIMGYDNHIKNNVIDSYSVGIYAGNQHGILISGNSIESRQAFSPPSTISFTGIYCDTCSGGSEISMNKIIMQSYYAGLSYHYGLYASFCMGDSLSPFSIHNNMISNLAGINNFRGAYLRGEYLSYSYNSVVINSAAIGSTCLQISAANSSIKNNILANLSGGKAVHVSGTSINIDSDFNNLFTTGSVLGYWNGDRNHLAAWQQASGGDANSVSFTPPIISPADLHLLNDQQLNIGHPQAGIQYDVDGQLRDPMYPDLGADEYDSVYMTASSTALCPGDTTLLSVYLSGTGPWTMILWNGSLLDTITGLQTMPWTVSLNPATTTTYKVLGFSNSLNTFHLRQDSLFILVKSVPTVDLILHGGNTKCQDEVAILQAYSSNPLGYEWYLNGNVLYACYDSILNASLAGTYTAIVTFRNGCKGTSPAVSISNYPQPVALIIPGSPTSFCEGDEVALSTLFNPSYTYQWYLDGIPLTNSDTSSIIATQSGEYVVKVTDLNGCSLVSPIVTLTALPKPTSTITVIGSTQLCDGDSLLLTATTGSSLSYEWMRNETLLSSSFSWLYVTDPGFYQVVCIDQNGCRDTSLAVEIIIHSLPYSSISCMNPQLCQGDTALIVANSTPGVTYQWFHNGAALPGETNYTLNTISPGLYHNLVTDVNGCYSFSNSLEISIYAPYGNETICVVTTDSTNGLIVVAWEKTPSVRTTGFGIYREGFITGQFTLIGLVHFDSLSIYTDYGANPNQQSYRYKISVFDSCLNESPMSSAHKTMHLTSNLGVNGEVNLIWTPYEGASFQSQRVLRSNAGASFIHIGQVAGNMYTFTDLFPPVGQNLYFIQIDLDQPCVSTTLKNINYAATRSNRISMNVTGTQEYMGSMAFDIYPNPNNGSLLISIPEPWTISENHFEVYNTLGQVVKTIKTNSGQTQLRVDVNFVPPGIYTVVDKYRQHLKRVVIL